MDETTFWKLIESSKAQCTPSVGDQAEILQEMLLQLPPEEIIAFDRLFYRFRDQAYTWSLWGAAYVIGGGCSDDGFDYFRAGLIAQGRDIYYAALKDPESLADLPDPGVEEFEEMLYVGRQAYGIATSEEMPDDAGYTHPQEPKGERWEEEKLEQLFPRLTERYG